jgi:serpin B
VLHKAFVDVNEAGTEAAAATAVVIATLSGLPAPPPPATFHADHPFVYLIRDDASGSILFAGRVANPGK